MTFRLTIRQQLMTWIIATVVVSLGALAFLVVIQLPTVAATRVAVDRHRAALVVADQRAHNLQAVSKQQTEITTDQQGLNSEIWKFTDEEKFFKQWDDLAHRTGVTIAEPNVTDATPTGKPIARAVNLTVTGSLNAVLGCLSTIQAITPVIAITDVVISPASLTNQVTAQLKASTLWQ